MLRRVIERVYLAYSGGTPLVHLSRSPEEGDPDLIASMFTALQSFMNDSFHSMGVGDVRSLEMGPVHHVAFGRGRYALLYVVYKGRESNRLERRVQEAVATIEERFRDVLKDWNGDMGPIDPVRAFLEEWSGVREALATPVEA